MGKQFWYNEQLRVVQTILREVDMINYNAKEVIQYLVDVRANCLNVNAGGIVDFFKNDIELANNNQFMRGEGILGELVEEAHRKGIRVITRVDFRGVDKDRYNTLPHWFALHHDGTPRIDHTGLYVPCFNSEYMNGHAVRYIQNLMSKYSLDGIWQNALPCIREVCYCKKCREAYKKEMNKELPVGEHYFSPVFDEYRTWKARYAGKHMKLMRDTVKSFGEEKAYVAEIFGIFNVNFTKVCSVDLYEAKRYFDFLVCPTFLTKSSGKLDDLSYASLITRFMKSMDTNMQTVVLAGNNGTSWRYIREPELDYKLWMWEATATGSGIWNGVFNGQYPAATHDNRNGYIEKEILTYQEDNESLFGTQIPVGDIGIFYSRPTHHRIADEDESKDQYGVFIKGLNTVMMDHHLQYTFIPDIHFTLEAVKKFKVLILPNTAYLSDEHIEIIREYVKDGGGLIASYETSLYQEDGRPRDDFGLKDVLGVSYTGIKKDTSYDCYQLIRNQHEVLQGMEKTTVLMNGGSTLLCTDIPEHNRVKVCTYIPVIINQPPEKAWIKNMETEYPTIVAGAYGKGKVVYFANQMDKLCYTHEHEDFRDIVYNAIQYVKSEALSIASNLPTSVHGILTQNNQNDKQYVLSLINLTSAPKRPIKQLLPVYDLDITLRLRGSQLATYTVFPIEGKVRIMQDESCSDCVCLQINVETLTEFMSIHIETI